MPLILLKNNNVNLDLSLNFWVIIASLISGSILIGIISYYFWGPTQRNIALQKKVLVKRNDEVIFREKQSHILLKIQKENYKKAVYQAQNIIKIAQEKAETIIKNSNIKAEKNSASLLLQTKEEIEHYKLKNTKYWKEYSGKLAIVLAEKIIQKELDPKIQEKIINEYLKELNN